MDSKNGVLSRVSKETCQAEGEKWILELILGWSREMELAGRPGGVLPESQVSM